MNAEPKEHLIFRSRGKCDDNFDSPNPTCGKYTDKDTNEPVVDSQVNIF